MLLLSIKNNLIKSFDWLRAVDEIVICGVMTSSQNIENTYTTLRRNLFVY